MGRAAELAELVGLLQGGNRLITVTGPGGVGNTRLWRVVPASLLALAALARGDGHRVRELLEPTLAFHEQHG